LTNGPPRYPNKSPATIDHDLRLAGSVNAVDRVVVLGVDNSETLDAAFELRVKWVVCLDNTIRIVPKHIDGVEISHAFLTNGEEVLAAGEAEIVAMGDGDYLGAQITNHSGHYEPPAASLALAVALFANHGIVFDEDAQEPVAGS